jgi:hypothetical protein
MLCLLSRRDEFYVLAKRVPGATCRAAEDARRAGANKEQAIEGRIALEHSLEHGVEPGKGLSTVHHKSESTGPSEGTATEN